MHIHTYSERRKEREKKREGVFLCHAGIGWDKKIASDIIEFMNIFLSSNTLWTLKEFLYHIL